jgi:hypothetical protein
MLSQKFGFLRTLELESRSGRVYVRHDRQRASRSFMKHMGYLLAHRGDEAHST